MPPKGSAPALPSSDKLKEHKEKHDAKKEDHRKEVGIRRQGSIQLREDWAKEAPPKRRPLKSKGKGKGKGGKGKGKGRMDAIKRLEARVQWKRMESVKAEFPPKLRKPKFGNVKNIKPDSKGLNFYLKCVSCDAVDTKGDEQEWNAVLGDETGIVKFRLRSQEHADLCKLGADLRVQNARVRMIKGDNPNSGFVHVIVDKWGVLKAADGTDNHKFEVEKSKDISSVEYEMVQA